MSNSGHTHEAPTDRQDGVKRTTPGLPSTTTDAAYNAHALLVANKEVWSYAAIDEHFARADTAWLSDRCHELKDAIAAMQKQPGKDRQSPFHALSVGVDAALGLESKEDMSDAVIVLKRTIDTWPDCVAQANGYRDAADQRSSEHGGRRVLRKLAEEATQNISLIRAISFPWPEWVFTGQHREAVADALGRELSTLIDTLAGEVSSMMLLDDDETINTALERVNEDFGVELSLDDWRTLLDLPGGHAPGARCRAQQATDGDGRRMIVGVDPLPLISLIADTNSGVELDALPAVRANLRYYAVVVTCVLTWVERCGSLYLSGRETGFQVGFLLANPAVAISTMAKLTVGVWPTAKLSNDNLIAKCRTSKQSSVKRPLVIVLKVNSVVKQDDAVVLVLGAADTAGSLQSSLAQRGLQQLNIDVRTWANRAVGLRGSAPTTTTVMVSAKGTPADAATAARCLQVWLQSRTILQKDGSTGVQLAPGSVATLTVSSEHFVVARVTGKMVENLQQAQRHLIKNIYDLLTKHLGREKSAEVGKLRTTSGFVIYANDTIVRFAVPIEVRSAIEAIAKKIERKDYWQIKVQVQDERARRKASRKTKKTTAKAASSAPPPPLPSSSSSAAAAAVAESMSHQ